MRTEAPLSMHQLKMISAIQTKQQKQIKIKFRQNQNQQFLDNIFHRILF